MAKALQYVEVDCDYCSLTYGVAPCTAGLYKAETKLLLHFDGADASTTIIDSSGNGRPNGTVFGNAQIDTAQSKFGGASGLFDGVGDYIEFPASADFDFGLADFTIDCWVRRATTADACPVAAREGLDWEGRWLFGYGGAGRLYFYASSTGGTFDIPGLDMGAIEFNVWHHYAVTRAGNDFRCFRDGVLITGWTAALDFTPDANPLSIGRHGVSNFYFGHIDEFRIVKGKALWVANFTPPAQAINPTGQIKCFNTIATCQDRANFTNAPVTLRYAVPTDYLPADIDCIPSIESIGFDPAVISLGKDLGQRATLTVTFEDHRHSDTGAGGDKYLADRPYDPYSQGTYWGKFAARQPFMRGRSMRWISGTLGQTLAEMETRHYLVDSISGPSNDGAFKIIAKDLLKLADGDRAMAPRVSNGFLVAPIVAANSTMTLSPSGVGAEYPATGYINLGGSEIVYYEHDPKPGGSITAATELLCHFDNTLADSSGKGRTITNAGGILFGTVRKFGSHALLLNGTATANAICADNAFLAPAGDFTLDCWFNVDDLAQVRTIASQFLSPNNLFFLRIETTGVITCNFLIGATPSLIMQSAAGAVVPGVTYHIALVRFGNVWRIFLNGAIVASTTAAFTFPNYNSGLYIGIHADNNAVSTFKGWIDEFRWTSAALWTAAFTVPAGPAGTSPDVFYIQRARLNTPASDHAAQDRAQYTIRYAGISPDLIIADLLKNYADVDSAYIPAAIWAAEIAAHLNRVYTATIPQPTAVNELLSELIEQSGLSLWWDDVNEQIGLLVLRGLIYTNELFSEQNMLADSLEISDQPEKRLSQVQTYFGQINPLTSLTDKANFRSVSTIIDAQSESDYGSPAIKEIFSRWIPNLGRAVADRVGTIMIGQFKDPPRKLGFQVLRGSTNNLVLANGYQVSAWPLQLDTGAAEIVNVQVTKLRPNPDAFNVECEEVLFTAAAEDLTNRHIIVDANSHNINLRAAHDNLFPDPVSGINVIFTINPGTMLGSTWYEFPSLTIGSWPAGVVIIVSVKGDIRGAGGPGGHAGPAHNGYNGGNCIHTRVPIKLAVPVGAKLWSGGGGGGGGGTAGGSGVAGCGGAGFDPGAAGASDALGVAVPGTLDHGGVASNPEWRSGGEPGQAGQSGISGGGLAGYIVDGWSYVTTGSWNGTVFTPGALGGDVRGPTIN